MTILVGLYLLFLTHISVWRFLGESYLKQGRLIGLCRGIYRTFWLPTFRVPNSYYQNEENNNLLLYLFYFLATLQVVLCV